ncbi:AMP-binding protein [Tistrella bauzanensis]
MRYLSPAPLHHAAPLRWSLAVIAAGGTAVIMRKFDAEHALHLIETRGITMSQWVPTMFRRLLDLPAERRVAFHAPGIAPRSMPPHPARPNSSAR